MKWNDQRHGSVLKLKKSNDFKRICEESSSDSSKLAGFSLCFWLVGRMDVITSKMVNFYQCSVKPSWAQLFKINAIVS